MAPGPEPPSKKLLLAACNLCIVNPTTLCEYTGSSIRSSLHIIISVFLPNKRRKNREEKRSQGPPLAMFQVFSEVSVLFSFGGKYYTGDPIVWTPMEDRIFETSRNMTVKLHHRIGKFVKLRFSFAAKWMMLSEITFDSGE